MSLDVYSQGRPLTRGQATQQLPHLKPEKRRNVFRIVAHPESWEFVDVGDGEWLPTIKCEALRPGVNGVSARPDGHLITSAWEAGKIRLGARDVTFNEQLQEDHGVEGEPGQYSLILEHAMDDGGRHFCAPWEHIKLINGRTRKEVDAPALHAFQRDVAKLLGGMPRDEYERRAQAHDARTENYRQDRHGGQAIERIIKNRDDKAAKMKAAWERQYGGAVTPKPVRKRKPEVVSE